jgi:chromosome segregation ATPase
MTNRYDNIPISAETKKKMTLNIDDLAAIGRVLSLQDNVYDEQFEGITKLLHQQALFQEEQTKLTRFVLDELKSLKIDVSALSDKVDSLEKKIGEIATETDNTKKEVAALKVEVAQLQKDHTLWNIIVKIGIGIGIGLGLTRWIHGPF